MKPLNLREFAEALALGDNREFAQEILDNLDFLETYPKDQIDDDLLHYTSKCGDCTSVDPLKQIEWLGDRSNLLGEIKDILDKNKLEGDPDDVVRDLAENDLALRGLLGLDPDGDIFEAVSQLVENQAKPMGYDL